MRFGYLLHMCKINKHGRARGLNILPELSSTSVLLSM